jgi:hypothetical protein
MPHKAVNGSTTFQRYSPAKADERSASQVHAVSHEQEYKSPLQYKRPEKSAKKPHHPPQQHSQQNAQGNISIQNIGLSLQSGYRGFHEFVNRLFHFTANSGCDGARDIIISSIKRANIKKVVVYGAVPCPL